MQPHCRPSPAVRTNVAEFSPGGLTRSALWAMWMSEWATLGWGQSALCPAQQRLGHPYLRVKPPDCAGVSSLNRGTTPEQMGQAGM